MDESNSSSATVFPGTSSSEISPLSLALPSSDELSIASVNPSPIVSTLSSSRLDDGYCSPQLSSQSGIQMSTPVPPSVDQEATQPSSCGHPKDQSTPQNPLVRAGLVPNHLADTFVTDHSDAASEKRGSRCITGVRVLTANDYVEMLKQKERKEREAAEQKQK